MESFMKTNEIEIPRKIIQQLLHLAQLSPEIEICGLISADQNGTPVTCFPITNSAETPHNRFLMHPGQQIAAMKTIRETGQNLFAVYHSHPTTPAYPSSSDLEQHSYPDLLQLIISLNTKGLLEIRAFRIIEKSVIELSMNLIDI
jgi:[CysO sulfur-carrier protein]-S-L-cysteine hydrolase